MDTDATPKVSGVRQLPIIPKLPPLEIPSSASFDNNDNDDDSVLPLLARNIIDEAPSASVHASASEESFATACTSPIRSPTSSADLGLIGIPPPRPSRSLAKSTSVDSFVNQRQDPPLSHPVPKDVSQRSRLPSNPTQPIYRDSVIDPDMDRWRTQRQSTSLPSSQKQPSFSVQNKFLQRTRASGRIMATVDSEESMYEDSEAELSGASTSNDPLRRRLMSVRELSRPHGIDTTPRTQALSATVSLTSLTSAHLVQRTQTRPTAFSNASIRSDPSSSQLPDSTRARSQSLGAQIDAHTRRNPSRMTKPMTTNAVETPHGAKMLSIAVVGPPGCGKSTFIRKALKWYNVTDPDACVARVIEDNKPRLVKYTRQLAYVIVDPEHEYIVSTFELSTNELLRDGDGRINAAWPSGMPAIDGAYVCYDSSEANSFSCIPDVLKSFDVLSTPTMALALRSDLERAVSPNDALSAIHQYAGLVEVTTQTDKGKKKMRRCVPLFINAIVKGRGLAQGESGIYRNPASPSIISAPYAPWDTRLPPATPAPQPSNVTRVQPHQTTSPERPSMKRSPSHPSIERASRPPSTPSSPSRTRSMNDLLSDSQRYATTSKTSTPKQSPPPPPLTPPVDTVSDVTATEDTPLHMEPSDTTTRPSTPPPPVATDPTLDEFSFGDKRDEEQEQPPPPWATFEEILEKLFFLAVSGDDPAFIKHFFLTYRRFATPRSVLLGMQKRMIELNQTSPDSVLSSYAQIRICSLLEQWIADYPSDFAVPGSHGALSALIKQIMKQTHTLYYGSDFQPFLDSLPLLTDRDEPWAIKADVLAEESDESDDGVAEEDTVVIGLEEEPPSSTVHPYSYATSTLNSPPAKSRSRKSSLPLPFISSANSHRATNGGPPAPPSPKEILAKLVRTSQILSNSDALAVAWEITRRELNLFLKIEPRDWLRHTLVSGKKDPETDPIARFNTDYNNLHDWAVSLILCHDKPKARARQIEKIAEIASHLRAHNNYSGLRALITAINQSTYPGDEPMEIFKANTFLHKKFLSSDVLLRTTGAHQSYRMALKNTKGPCIPSLEVHTSDLRRAHEGNPDFKSDDPSSIHWAKFSMIGKFVSSTLQFQDRCQGPLGYHIPEISQISQLFDVPLMDYDMQQSRIFPPPSDDVDTYVPPIASTVVLESSGQAKDTGIRRLIFW